MLRDAQRRREGKKLAFWASLLFGAKKSLGVLAGRFLYWGSVARPKVIYVSRGERCAATPLLVLQPESLAPTCWPLPRIC